MSLNKNLASNFKLYCIIDKTTSKGNPVKEAYLLFRKGIKLLQLRYKNQPSYKILPIASKISKLAKKFGAYFFINDRIDLALASGSSGVHLGSGDIGIIKARAILGESAKIGKTIHSVKEAKNSRYSKINYVGAGPMFFTPLKRNLKKKGALFIKKVSKIANVPVFAIGGINKNNAKKAFAAGADGICVTRATKEMKELLSIIK